MIRTRSTARIVLVCIYLLNYFINRKFPAVKQSVFLLDRKFSVMWQGSKVLLNETRGRKFHGTFVPGNESTRGRKFQGTKVPWNFRSRGRKFHPMELSSPGTKVPDTGLCYIALPNLAIGGKWAWAVSKLLVGLFLNQNQKLRFCERYLEPEPRFSGIILTVLTVIIDNISIWIILWLSNALLKTYVQSFFSCSLFRYD